MKRLMQALNSNTQEKEQYRGRHDEMFSQTSALNSRIEELENHKMLLLDKLKNEYGDKGSLDYIIKSQGLENVKGKKLTNRISNDEYNPEANRRAADDHYKNTSKSSFNTPG